MSKLQAVDRIAAFIMPTPLMLDWINENAAEEEVITMEEIQADATVILLPDFDDEDQAEGYLRSLYLEIFETELASWEEDENVWPDDRSWHTFLEWFDIEFHSMVYVAKHHHDDINENDELMFSNHRKSTLQ